MSKMIAFQVKHANGPFEKVEREIPEPKSGQVRIKVKACGICHSDSMTKDGIFPGIAYPRIPGHEVAGLIDALGPDVNGWKVGQRVGIGWHGGHCGYCNSCRKGDFVTCQVHPQIPGVTFDGGYANYMITPATSLALIPDDLSFVEAGPLMCAGITTYNSLRHSGAIPGDIVAVLGVGGLGHLAIQFASKMGYKTIAIARGREKENLSKELGAHHYMDSESEDVAQELIKLGGAKVILATAINAKAMSSVVNGLSINGKLVILGVSLDPLEVSPLALISGRRSITGWPSGSSIDSEETMSFCALSNVRSMSEIYPFDQAPEAYERMMSGQARFRVVLEMDH